MRKIGVNVVNGTLGQSVLTSGGISDQGGGVTNLVNEGTSDRDVNCRFGDREGDIRDKG